MPEPLTVPKPEPSLLSVSGSAGEIVFSLWAGRGAKTASMLSAVSIVTVQVSAWLPSQSPPFHSLNVEWKPGLAVSSTELFSYIEATALPQVIPHLIPFGLDETEP